MPAKRKYLKGDPRHDEGQQKAGQNSSRHGGQGSRERRRERREQERAQTTRSTAVMPRVPIFEEKRTPPPQPPKADRPKTDEEKLRDQVRQAGEDFRKTMRTSPLFGNESTSASNMKQLSNAHRKYQGMMMMAVFQPLEQGVNVASIVRAVTMARVMWAYSPEFKDMVTSIGEKAFGQLDGEVTNRLAKMKLAKKPGAEFLDSHWTRIRNMREGDRIPFTAQSAGLAEIGLLERAYDAMREPGADAKKVTEQYNDAVGKLYAMAEYDGVSSEEVSRCARVVAGQMLKDDPATAAMFNETAYADFRVAPDKEAVVGTTGRVVSYWDGTFQHSSGATVDSGSFGPRAPRTADEHQALIARSLANDFMSSDVQHFHSSMMTYAMSWGSVPREEVRNHPDLDPEVRRRFNDTATFVRSMREDGVAPGDAQFAYSSAFTDAMDIVAETRPELAQEWAAKYGERWFKDIQDMVHDPKNANGIWERVDQQMRAEGRSEAGNRGTHNSRDHASTDPRADYGGDREYPGAGQTTNPAPTRPGGETDAGWPRHEPNPMSRPGERARRAERNQRYNEADTGLITGIGVDDADLTTPGRERDDDEPQLGG